jgi:RNA polymerase sigma-70 factor (ECF subfamily)
MTPPPLIPGDPSFPSTDWGLVGDAAWRDTAAGKAALKSLCLRYWYPIYAFIRRDGIRRQGTPEPRAEDLTQAFFAQILRPENHLLANANPQKGTFKSYLLEACRNFLKNHRKKGRSDVLNDSVVSLDALRDAAERFDLEPAAPDPEAGFDGDWAFAVLTAALEAVRRRYTDRGSAALFDRLRPYLPFHDGERPGPQAEAAEQGGQSVEAYKQALFKLRAAFREQVKFQIAQTLSDPAAVEEEIRSLLANVRRIPSPAPNGRPALEARQ